MPVIVVAAQAPAFAASFCAAVPFPTGWTWPSVAPARGLNDNSGTTGYANGYGDGVYKFLSEKDNKSLASETGNDVTVTLSKNLTLVAGRQYTFTFTVASQFSHKNTTMSQIQTLQVQIGGSDRLQLVKRSSNNTLDPAGYKALADTAYTDPVVETFAFPFTPTTASNTLTYRFTLPALGKTSGTWGGNADIAISAPTISGC